MLLACREPLSHLSIYKCILVRASHVLFAFLNLYYIPYFFELSVPLHLGKENLEETYSHLDFTEEKNLKCQNMSYVACM